MILKTGAAFKKPILYFVLIFLRVENVYGESEISNWSDELFVDQNFFKESSQMRQQHFSRQEKLLKFIGDDILIKAQM
jgi:hypothetical protein